VVIAPYTMQSAVVIKSPAPVFFNYTACRVVATIYSQPIFFGLRGPPSIS
jgi:hypothetical protein